MLRKGDRGKRRQETGDRRQETGDRRQETVSAIKIIRSNLPLRHQEYYTGFRVCDLEFEIWDFTHLPILGELGGLFFQDPKNKADNSDWSLVIGHWALGISKEAEERC